MALTNEDFFELRELLDVLHREQASELEVAIIEGKGTTVRIGPTSYGSVIFGFEDLPGVQRSALTGDSFGGWKAEFSLKNGDILRELQGYKPEEGRKRLVQEAFSRASEEGGVRLQGANKSALWIEGFDNEEAAASFGSKLQSAGCRVRLVGSAILVEDPWLKAYLTEFTEEPFDKGAEEKQPDAVNHPSHYASESGLEAIEVIEAFFHGNAFLANTFKYIARAGKKGGEAKRLEDLKKARWYLEREIKREEAREDS
nr:MAG TPA: nucelotide kinase [Caudoviricetes sp.]